MRSWQKQIKKYIRRGKRILNVKKIGSSVAEHQNEYAILMRAVKNGLLHGLPRKGK